jgi:hypothetical protein
MTFVPVDHPLVRAVEIEIFTLTFAPDCMTHRCRCDDDAGKELLDACCQHGVDVDLFERDAIMKRAREIQEVLRAEFRDPSTWWRDDEAEPDDEAPSGTYTRTNRAGPGDAGGCMFLQHDARGCALHRAAVNHRFDPSEIKPAVCRLYPLAWGEGLLGLSDDFSRYSCASVTDRDAPSVWQVSRDAVAEVFGIDLQRKLDRLERDVYRRRLPVYA